MGGVLGSLAKLEQGAYLKKSFLIISSNVTI